MHLAPAAALLAAAVMHAQAPPAAANAPHWAFAAPQKHVPPAEPGDRWSRDELDRIVLAALRQGGLSPAPEADRRTLLRRMHLVLTGLPPSPDEVAAFAADASADAYERRVDALLLTPACAEHMAAAWLDLAHFADTYGYQADFECRTWPWRDWLIAALQQDLPYDQFVRQLVAGDLLPEASPETQLATAFFRLHRQTNEGGSIDDEWRQEYIADRVDTFGTAFLGLTIGCARCHDHKFDPITQQDFYALGSFFSIDDSGLYPYSTGATPRPAMRLMDGPQRQQRAALARAVEVAEGRLAAAVATAATTPPDAAVPIAVAPPIARYAFDDVAGGKTGDAVRKDQPASVASGVTLGDGHAGRGVQFDGDAGIAVPKLPAFTRDDAYSLAFWLWCPDRKERAVVLHTSQYTEDADTQGYQVLLQDGRLCWEIAHYWPGSAIALRTAAVLPLQQWLHVVVSYDGSSRASGLCVYLDGARAATEVVRDGLDGPATVRALQLGARDRDRGFAGGRLDDFAVYDRCLTAFEVARLRGVATAAALLREHATATAATVVQARSELQAARRALHAMEEALPELMVLAAHPSPPQRYLLLRGAYDQPDRARPVPPDVPKAVLPFDPALPRTRLGLAAWLTSPHNPLLARVQINRLWTQCFGQGLVRTPENFGRLGEAPVHQDLLDALACDFAAGGFDNKAMLRRIVGSATFRQASAATPAQRERDPDNRLLARGPSFRLTAEMLRDQALAASGLLQLQVGGKSVRPWQPPGLWRDAGVGWGGADYQPDSGADAHRRSLYTFLKRTAPPPDMTAFDAPSREVCTARRQDTDTPLQALVCFNDPVFVECAEALAARVQRELPQAPSGDRIARAFAYVAARPPRPKEAAALQRLHDGQCRGAADPSALVLVCSTLLASDQAMVLR